MKERKTYRQMKKKRWRKVRPTNEWKKEKTKRQMKEMKERQTNKWMKWGKDKPTNEWLDVFFFSSFPYLKGDKDLFHSHLRIPILLAVRTLLVSLTHTQTNTHTFLHKMALEKIVTFCHTITLIVAQQPIFFWPQVVTRYIEMTSYTVRFRD